MSETYLVVSKCTDFESTYRQFLTDLLVDEQVDKIELLCDRYEINYELKAALSDFFIEKRKQPLTDVNADTFNQDDLFYYTYQYNEDVKNILLANSHTLNAFLEKFYSESIAFYPCHHEKPIVTLDLHKRLIFLVSDMQRYKEKYAYFKFLDEIDDTLHNVVYLYHDIFGNEYLLNDVDDFELYQNLLPEHQADGPLKWETYEALKQELDTLKDDDYATLFHEENSDYNEENRSESLVFLYDYFDWNSELVLSGHELVSQLPMDDFVSYYLEDEQNSMTIYFRLLRNLNELEEHFPLDKLGRGYLYYLLGTYIVLHRPICKPEVLAVYYLEKAKQWIADQSLLIKINEDIEEYKGYISHYD